MAAPAAHVITTLTVYWGGRATLRLMHELSTRIFDAKFATKDTFLYCRVQKGVAGHGCVTGYGSCDQVGC